MPPAPLVPKNHRRLALARLPLPWRVGILIIVFLCAIPVHQLLGVNGNYPHFLAFIPVTIAGLAFGAWGGLLGAAAMILIEIFFWHLDRLLPVLSDPLAMFRDQMWIIYAALLIVGWIVGRLRTTWLALQTELIQRAAIEEQLRAEQQQHRELAERAQHQAQELTLLDQVHFALSPEVDQDAIFRKVVEIISRVFSYHQASIYLLRDDFLLLQHQVGYTGNTMEKIPLGTGVMSRCARTARPILIQDTDADPDFLGRADQITSEIAVPLFDQGRVIGVFNVESRHETRLDENDLRVMLQIAAYINIAVERARLYAAEREQRALSEALYDNARALNRSLQIDDVLRSVLTNVEQVVPCSAAAIILLDSGTMRILARRAASGKIIDTMTAETMGGMLRYFTQITRPVIIDDANNIPGWINIAAMKWIRSLMISPVMVKDQQVALLFLGGESTHFFRESQIVRLQVLVEQAGAAIENARLFESVARSARHLALLNQITGLALRATTLDEIYHELAARLVDLISADGAFIARWDAAAQLPILVSAAGILAENYHTAIPQPGEPTLTAAVLAANQTIAVEDTGNSPHISARLGQLLDNKSVLGIPLIADDQKLGAVLLGFRHTHQFTPEEIALAEQAAGQTALAINRLLLIERIGQMAITDDLTGLLNFRGLRQFGQREVERALRFNRPLAGLMLDLDWFKAVNDQYGHPVGNITLREVARAIRQNVRDIDIVGRYGGEEFFILLPESNLLEAHQVAERLRQTIAGLTIHTGEDEIHITVSLGVAIVTRTLQTLDQLIHRADQALYRAKQTGRNRVAVFSRATSEISET